MKAIFGQHVQFGRATDRVSGFQRHDAAIEYFLIAQFDL